jgi:DNA-binding NtrC family response regulator
MTDNASILVVDDEENLRHTLALILKREGYTVTTAATVQEARKHLQNGLYHLAFLDLKLPDASGLTLLPDLRSQYPDMPVLILTAHDKLEAATEAVRKGARDFLLKPVDPLTIIQRVKEVLAERENPKSVRRNYSHLQKLLKEQRLDSNLETPPPKKPEQ